MKNASEGERFEEAAGYRDLLRTLAEMEERQKIAAASGDDTDVIAWYAEPPQVAKRIVFHIRGGRVVDRLETFTRKIRKSSIAASFLPSLAEAAVSRHCVSSPLHPYAH